MSTDGRQPSPDFDEGRYERPQKDWMCGHACDGCPCRLGPSPSGKCRAGPECKPLLVVPPGETKGLWKCTRAASEGGPCPDGPHPDGTCCRATPTCVPVRSLRARRGLMIGAVVGACAALLLLALSGPRRQDFINPGPLSTAHSSPGFALARGQTGMPSPQGCVHCHAVADQEPMDWISAALSAAADPDQLSPHALLGSGPSDFGAMDSACQACHQPHSFHQASITRDTSCSTCHLEHQGRDKDLRNVNPVHCVECHGDMARMHDASARAAVLPPELFAKTLPGGQTAFPVERPPEGLTAGIMAFGLDHPEFRLHGMGATDANPLAFNHALHLSGPDIPNLDGKPLDCRTCHQPDPSGALMRPVKFALHCQSCHGLTLDPETPSIAIPHGSAENARAYLRALPAAYSDDAVRRLGLSGEPLRAHVAQKLAAFHTRQPSGEALERQVFFGDPSGPAGRDACSLCHVVAAGPAGTTPHIVPPKVPDVWLPRAKFDHGKHTQVSCVECHAATGSSLTTDVLMPKKASCVTCHSPAGGVSDSCTFCHGYHNPVPAGLADALARHPVTIPVQLQRAVDGTP